jgi:hypothetical protein
VRPPDELKLHGITGYPTCPTHLPLPIAVNHSTFARLMDVLGSGKSAPGRNRTCDLALRRHSLYPLSYRGQGFEAGSLNLRPQMVVEEKGIEPSTFALRTRRSPN